MQNPCNKQRAALLALLSSLLVGACTDGNNSDGPGSGDQPISTGVFIDSAVANITYRTIDKIPSILISFSSEMSMKI